MARESGQPRQDRRHVPLTAASIPWAPASACAAAASRRWCRNSRAKIDIIPWSPDPATFVVNALAPAEVAKVVLDEDSGRIEVVVPDDQFVWRSAGAGRTCAWPRSSPASTSTS